MSGIFYSNTAFPTAYWSVNLTQWKQTKWRPPQLLPNSVFRDNIGPSGQTKSDNFPGVKAKEQKSKLNIPLEGTEELHLLRADVKKKEKKRMKRTDALTPSEV